MARGGARLHTSRTAGSNSSISCVMRYPSATSANGNVLPAGPATWAVVSECDFPWPAKTGMLRSSCHYTILRPLVTTTERTEQENDRASEQSQSLPQSQRQVTNTGKCMMHQCSYAHACCTFTSRAVSTCNLPARPHSHERNTMNAKCASA